MKIEGEEQLAEEKAELEKIIYYQERNKLEYRPEIFPLEKHRLHLMSNYQSSWL